MCRKSLPRIYNKERNFTNFHCNGKHASDIEFPSNFIKTSKYTCLNFVPYSILLQFKRTANVYFLVTAVVQSIPAISPLNPISAIAPFMFIMIIAMIREWIEDRARSKHDKQMNSMSTTLMNEKGEKVPST